MTVASRGRAGSVSVAAKRESGAAETDFDEADFGKEDFGKEDFDEAEPARRWGERWEAMDKTKLVLK
jgi:hypothetical protein